MTYEPREGVDYIVDFYALAGIEPEAVETDIRTALNQQVKQYHPDRLEGLAPEIKEKGERIAKLLNRARGILLDSDSRTEYDNILSEWDGPISTDGTPVITIERAYEAEMEWKTPAEVEAHFIELTEQINTLTNYNPHRLAFLETLIADGEPSDELRAEYEDALLQKDRALALEEAERSKLLGLPDMDSERYAATLNYGEEIEDKIDTARTEKLAEIERRSIGGVATRLALLSGDTENEKVIVPQSLPVVKLPLYFEEQAARVLEIAKSRAELVDKRLLNWVPEYPEEEIQDEPRERLIVGVFNGESYYWIGFKLDTDNDSAEFEEVDESTIGLLDKEDFKSVISQGYGIVKANMMDQIDNNDLIGVAIGKYTDKFKTKL